MIIKIILISLLLASGSLQAEPYPILNINYPDHKGIQSKYVGTETSFEGKVIEFTESGKNTPYFKIKLRNKTVAELWSAMLFSSGKGKGISIGDNVKIFGYYSSFEKDIISVGENKTGFHVLTFCLVNTTTLEFYFMPQGIKQCEAWRNGEIPKT